MFFCEECRVKRRWPMSFGGSYGRCEICGNEDSCYDVPSKLLPVPIPVPTKPMKPKQDVHTAHCCQKHGCKYFGAVGGKTACTVKLHGGQEYMCEQCHEELYEDGEWETAHLMNEMFEMGRRYALKRMRKLIDDTKEMQKERRQDWILRA